MEVDARRLRLRRGARLARHRAADPQRRHRRRHDEARGGRARASVVATRRDPHRRAPPRGGRGEQDRAARSGRQAPCRARPASTGSSATLPRRSDLERVAEWMADALVSALAAADRRRTSERLFLTEPLGDDRGIGRHHVLRRRRRIRLRARDARFRRSGPPPRRRRCARPLDAGALAAGRCCRPANASAPPRSAPPNIRVQLSGNTIYVSESAAAAAAAQPAGPAAGLDCSGDIDPDAPRARRSGRISRPSTWSRARSRWRWPSAGGARRPMRGFPRFATGIARGLPRTIAAGKPIYLVLDGDVAQMLGHLLA